MDPHSALDYCARQYCSRGTVHCTQTHRHSIRNHTHTPATHIKHTHKLHTTYTHTHTQCLISSHCFSFSSFVSFPRNSPSPLLNSLLFFSALLFLLLISFFQPLSSFM